MVGGGGGGGDSSSSGRRCADPAEGPHILLLSGPQLYNGLFV